MALDCLCTWCREMGIYVCFRCPLHLAPEVSLSSALGVNETAGELGATLWPDESHLGCWEQDPREDTSVPCWETWHLTSLVSSPWKPAEETWPAFHCAHCCICELCPHVGPISSLVTGKRLPAGTNRCTKTVWSYLWLQNLKGLKDSSSRSGWMYSCLSPCTQRWLLPPHISAPCTVGCFTPHAPQLSHFFLNKTL